MIINDKTWYEVYIYVDVDYIDLTVLMINDHCYDHP